MTDSPSNKAMTIASAILMATLAAMLAFIAPSYGAVKGDPTPKLTVGTVTVLSSAGTLVPTSNLLGRNAISIFNNGPNTIWCSEKSTVTTSTGYPILANTQLGIDVVAQASSAPTIYCIASTADQVSPANTRVMEVK